MEINVTPSYLEEIGYDNSDVYEDMNVAYHPVVLRNKIKVGRCVLDENFFSGWMTEPLRVWPSGYGCDYFDEVYVYLPNKNLENTMNLGTFGPVVVQPLTYTYNINNYNASHGTSYWGFDSVQFTVLPVIIEALNYESDITTNGSHTILKANDTNGMSSVTFNVNVRPNLGTRYITSNATYVASLAGYDGYSSVTVSVQPNLTNKLITDNGIYNASSEGVDGYREVTVSVDKRPVIRKMRVGNDGTGLINFETNTFNKDDQYGSFVNLSTNDGLVVVIDNNTYYSIYVYYCSANHNGGTVGINPGWYYRTFSSSSASQYNILYNEYDSEILMFGSFDLKNNNYEYGYILVMKTSFILPPLNT